MKMIGAMEIKIKQFITCFARWKNSTYRGRNCIWIRKKCYAIGEYEATDTLYNIFEEIFSNEKELEEFLKKSNK